VVLVMVVVVVMVCGVSGGCVDKIFRLLKSAIHHELLSRVCGGFIERRYAWNCPSIQT